MLIPTSRVDVLKVGAAYLHFLGDLPRTSVACGVPVDTIRQLEREHDWPAKLEQWQRTTLACRDEDDGKAINRTQNLIQSRRLRDLLDKVISNLLESPEADLAQFFTRVDPKTGERIPDTKPLVDIARTAEIVHALTYRALGDTEASNDTGAPKAQDVALAVAGALNKVLDKLPGASACPKIAEVINV